ncbi:MAG: sigma-70 family RNA polymerase sigma factor [Candidatus Gracilibacteria bacterium]|nr:sigma-70 family RNA polymerase sigma factor [Candidatus Gracilibacteria bacterium]
METLPAITAAIDSYKRLSQEEERELIQKVQKGDVVVLDKLVKNNLRIIASLARKYSRANETLFKDLFNEGVMGFIKAIRKFDLTKNNRLITYASWWIRQAILNSDSLQTTWCKKLNYKERTLQRLTEEFKRVNRDYPNAQELYAECEKLDLFDDSVTIANLEEWLAYYRTNKIVSLDEPVGEDSDSVLGDFVADKGWDEVLKRLEHSSEMEIVLAEMQRLTDLQKTLLEKKYLEDKELTDIAAELDISRETVIQTLGVAEKHLRNLLKQTCLADKF